MPILKQTRTVTGLVLGYHNPMKMEVDIKRDTAKVIIESFSDEEAALAGLDSSWHWEFNFPMTVFNKIGTIKDAIETALIAQADLPFYGGEIITDLAQTIEGMKQRKNADINYAQDKANTTFIFDNVEIESDPSSLIQITRTNGTISLLGDLPDDWSGTWKAKDNSYVQIPDKAAWVRFYTTLSKRVEDNFKQAQELKVALADATTQTEVEVIRWDFNR